ncbi:Kiwellin [Heracleum sosnowskyi]|uniref:Kiwellin n=1 Tax=Heracleum sosnowskyi TaxID=360622 RepID=A0AAD8H0B7_9APIA|nr:Kiwellin [Heracleum sosnowskyi]
MASLILSTFLSSLLQLLHFLGMHSPTAIVHAMTKMTARASSSTSTKNATMTPMSSKLSYMRSRILTIDVVQEIRLLPTSHSSTLAILTLNDFSEGGDGGAESSCDEKFHKNTELIVTLSTGWFSGGSRCSQEIRISASNGNSVVAKVVDECDSMNGCDAEHANQRTCDNNIVDGSAAVWNALRLDQDLGRVDINWSMV